MRPAVPSPNPNPSGTDAERSFKKAILRLVKGGAERLAIEAGQIDAIIDPGTGNLAGDTIQAQTRQALANCEAVLQAGGARLDDVVEVGVLLTNPADFAGLNEEYGRWFPADPPTRDRKSVV